MRNCLIFIHLFQCTLAFNSPGGLLNFLLKYQKICFCRCGINLASSEVSDGDASGRVVGHETKPHEFPWLALVNVGSKSIGGSLISDRHVITAASPLHGHPSGLYASRVLNVVSCLRRKFLHRQEHSSEKKDYSRNNFLTKIKCEFFYRLKPKEVTVTLGSHNRCNPEGNPTLNSSVEAILMHPGFSSSVKVNDIALLRLIHVITFSRFVSPICLPNAAQGPLLTSQLAWVAGWTERLNSSCVPRVAVLPTLPSKTCMRGTDPSLVTPDKGCLGPLGIKSVICEDDIGSPIMALSNFGAFKLIGITSLSTCEEPTTPLYTRVGDHAPWIYENIRSDCRCF